VVRILGSTSSKERLRVLLQNIAGELSVADACNKLHISEARFHELRATMLSAAVKSLEPKPAGRPVQTHHPDSERILELEEQRNIRIAALAFRRWIARYHSQKYDAAALLELHPRTIARWHQLWLEAKLRSLPNGRPFVRSQPTYRNDIKYLLDVLGPHVGCSTLEIFFPLMSRRELRRFLKRYRRIWRRRKRFGLHQLHWHRPGSVWAIDYTDPPAPIDGLYSAILVVRDLASGYQLLALPTSDKSAKTARDALIPLFRKHRPPIVLKSDNGSFRAHDFIRFLKSWDVCPLLSPPAQPQYNGAVEAGIGSIKTRTHHIAALHGRPGEWTCDDVEAARLLANATARPNGRLAPTPHFA